MQAGLQAGQSKHEDALLFCSALYMLTSKLTKCLPVPSWETWPWVDMDGSQQDMHNKLLLLATSKGQLCYTCQLQHVCDHRPASKYNKQYAS
jgi:hypothetical protein